MRKMIESGSGAIALAVLVGLSGCGSDTSNPTKNTPDASKGDGAAGAPSSGGTGSGGKGTGGADAGKGDGGNGNGNGNGDGGNGNGSGGDANGDGGRVSGDGGGPASGGGAGAGNGGSTDSGGSGNGGSTGGSAGDTGGTGGGSGGVITGGAGGAGAVGGSDGGTIRGAPVTLTVDLTANSHPISPLIYGVNGNSLVACTNADARFTLCRQGSDPSSTYNWENNASNSGSSCFVNDGRLGGGDTPAGAVTSFIDDAGARATVVTLPLLDYVAADKNSGPATASCTGTDVRNSGADYLDTRFKKNRARKGAALSTTPDTTDDFVNQDEFVSAVKAHAPSAHALFAMDNQTELWSLSHPEVHPTQTTYAEIVAKNTDYASMVRDQWPGAEIAGFVGYGFQAFLDLQGAPDASGKPDFVSYYLAAMKQASDTAGERLIDYLDVHWYSEASANGTRVIAPDGSPPDPAIVEQRVQAPRSLWDSTYKENSWIANDYMAGPINLLAWLNQRVTANYPGTKLAFSAWTHGGDEDISGGIAAADTLGIFGREGVALAATDTSASAVSFLVGAFAAFRNYDGAGAAFGDTSVGATTSDIARVSVYGSIDSTVANRVVVIVINRDAAIAPTTLTLQHAPTFASASVFQITAQSPLPHAATGLTATGADAFTFDAPAYSISVIVPGS